MERAVTLGLALDGVLALALPLMAWRVLASRDLRTAIVLFMALGLLSALAWARLAAPDIALVEAAIGTGVTGALLMSCLPWAGALSRAEPPPSPRRREWYGGWLDILPAAALIVGLGWVMVALPEPNPGLSREVLGELDRSGVSHPVTAVLLNYRAYDTLLEIVVLIAAAVGIDAITPPERVGVRTSPRSVVGAMARLLLPGFVLVAGYLVWKGAHAPGGAFQGGAVLAGGGLMLLLARRLPPVAFRSRIVRVLVLSGPTVFLALAAAPLAWGTRMLAYPPGWAGVLILALESVLVATIAVALLAFFPATVLSSSRGPDPQEDAP